VRYSLVVLAVLVTLVVAGSSPAGSLATEIVRWSPFDAAGDIKSGLEVQQLGQGECLGRSLTIGARGYRCKAGRWVLDPCWRSDDGVVCAGFPWDTVVSTIRVPGFPRNAHGEQPQPWAIELADGHRCRVLQSSHANVTLRGRPLAVDYDCDDGLVLLRNLSGGRVWRVAAARWADGRYAVEPDVVVRRAFFGARGGPVSDRR